MVHHANPYSNSEDRCSNVILTCSFCRTERNAPAISGPCGIAVRHVSQPIDVTSLDLPIRCRSLPPTAVRIREGREAPQDVSVTHLLVQHSGAASITTFGEARSAHAILRGIPQHPSQATFLKSPRASNDATSVGRRARRFPMLIELKCLDVSKRMFEMIGEYRRLILEGVSSTVRISRKRSNCV